LWGEKELLNSRSRLRNIYINLIATVLGVKKVQEKERENQRQLNTARCETYGEDNLNGGE
jgi:hypothetical protein